MALFIRFFVVCFAIFIASVATGATFLATSSGFNNDLASMRYDEMVFWNIAFSVFWTAIFFYWSAIPIFIGVLITEAFSIRSPLVYAVAGGLGVVLLITAVVWLLLRNLKQGTFSTLAYVLLGVGTLIRTDAALPFAIVIAFMALYDAPNRRKHLMVGLPILIGFIAAQTLFRLAYYGDIVPNIPEARVLAVLEAISGQLYLAILMARLVGLHLNQSSTALELGGPATSSLDQPPSAAPAEGARPRETT